MWCVLAGGPADRRLGRVFSARYGYDENTVTDALLIHLGHRPGDGGVGRGNYCFNFIEIYIYIHLISYYYCYCSSAMSRLVVQRSVASASFTRYIILKTLALPDDAIFQNGMT